MVWHLNTIGESPPKIERNTYGTVDIGIAVQSLLNNALDDDTLDEGYVSSVSPSLVLEKTNHGHRY